MQQSGASALSDAGDDLYYGSHLLCRPRQLAVASAHIQEEFGITKAQMGYVFSAFAALYAMSDPAVGFRSRRFSRDLFYCDIWLVSGDFIPWLCLGINVINWSARDNRYFRSARFPDQ